MFVSLAKLNPDSAGYWHSFVTNCVFWLVLPVGLEWEDDFSALEKNCHFQCVGHSVSEHYTPSLPTQRCTTLSGPERFSLSQACLFLTHVTESDLELWDKGLVTHSYWGAGADFYDTVVAAFLPAFSQRPPRCRHGLMWHPHLFFSQTASLGLMEKLTNRPDLVPPHLELTSPPPSSFMMSQGF